MKPSEMLMLVLFSEYYEPEFGRGYKKYMCTALRQYVMQNHDNDDEAIWTTFCRLERCIARRMTCASTLQLHLFQRGIAVDNYAARYEWFFDLALELENMGQ